MGEGHRGGGAVGATRVLHPVAEVAWGLDQGRGWGQGSMGAKVSPCVPGKVVGGSFGWGQ